MKKKVQDIYPLSPMQSGLLFQNLYSPNSDAYFTQQIFEIEGELNANIFKKAWQSVFNHYPVLNSAFVWEDLDIPLQYTIKEHEILFEFKDWTKIKEDTQYEKLNSFIQEERSKGFDLTKAPLYRLTLIQCSLTKYNFIWSRHHILTDGWSSAIIIRDFLKAYRNIIENRKVNFRITRPYRDYIAWLQEQDLTKAELFWKQYLASRENLNKLSFEDIIEENKEKDYERYFFDFTQEESDQIRNFAREHNLTLNTFFQYAVGTILKSYSRQEDVIIGVTISGRNINLPGVEEMVGLLINTIPLRIGTKSGENILSSLHRLQSEMQILNDYAYVSLAQIQAWAKVKNLFDVLFVFENYPVDELSKSNDDTFNISRVRGIEKSEYPLTLTVVPGEKIHFVCSYQTKHFNERLIKNFSEHLREVLKGIINSSELQEHPYNIKTQSISFLTLKEKNQLLIEWNETTVDFPSKNLHLYFEDQVFKSQDNVAVVYKDIHLTYRELNAKTNQLAHYLKKLGITPDTPIVIAMEKSIEMVISILGVLKVGGAYVPVDPSYPLERFKFILNDTNAPIIITDKKTINKLPSTLAHVICIDEEWNFIKELSSENLQPVVAANNLAYIIYTSGSTGEPKGVMISQSNLINYLMYAKKKYPMQNGASIVHSSIAFDMSVTSLFLPLLMGNYILLLDTEPTSDSLLKVLNDKNFDTSFIKVTPTHLNILKEHLELRTIQKQKGSLIVGGEKLTSHDIGFWLASAPNAYILNEYGPTETTVGCSTFKIPLQNREIKTIPIGRPIFNTQIYILDSFLNPVPVGIAGEIYVGGIGLARGYINKPDLTSERFIPNLFATESDLKKGNTRLYKTGDLGRHLLDGNIEFLGRVDHQVKVRGFRIELGEIESTLVRYSDVSQAIVKALEVDGKYEALIAYVVPFSKINFASDVDNRELYTILKGEAAQTFTEKLKKYLTQSLPDYMIPNFFVYLDKFPLNQNGKIDRQALPNPQGREEVEEYIPPQGSLEKKLGSIWLELLRINQVSRHDNFFNLGGHSLTATRLTSKIRSTLKVEIPLKAIFEHPILSEFAEIIEHEYMNNGNLLPSIKVVERDKPIPLSFAQQRLWFLEQLLPELGLYHIPITFKITGNFSRKILQEALNYLVARHEVLRTKLISVNGIAHQEILEDTIGFRLEYRQFQDISKEELNKVIRYEISRPFNFEKEALCRGVLIEVDKKENILVLTFHHAVSDGWSMEIIHRELNEIYDSFLTKQNPKLETLPIQYADFSVWQRDWLQGEVLEKQLLYWKEKLFEAPNLALPTDNPRPMAQSYKGGHYEFCFTKGILDKLHAVSRQEEVTLFMTLLAAFKGVLARYSNMDDIVVGTPIANRRNSELEGLIGFFVNTLTLRTSTKDNPNFKELLKRVQSTTLNAYEHQDVPFEQLVDHLGVTRDLSRHPLFQVMFVLQNKEETQSKNRNLELTYIEGSNEILSKFDLTLNAIETDKGLKIGIVYAKDLYSENWIKNLAYSYQKFIEEIVENSDMRLSEVDILAPQDRAKLAKWNKTDKNYPTDKCVHELFEDVATKNSDKIAVVYNNHQYSYGWLKKQVEEMSSYLLNKGVLHGDLVLLYSDRGINHLISLLSIMRVGAVYVPLDPKSPNHRNLLCIKACGAKYIVLPLILKSQFKSIETEYNLKISKIFIEDANKEKKISILKKEVKKIDKQDLAYILFTSGSTGVPKGAMVAHQGMLNHIYSKIDELALTNEDRIAQNASQLFDISVWQMLTALLCGGIVHIMDDQVAHSPFELLKEVNIHHINILEVVPSMLSAVLEDLSGRKNTERLKLNNLRYLILTGENLPTSLCNQWHALYNTIAIMNAYGPTECSDDIAHYILKNPRKLHRASVPIGKTILNTQIHILDPFLNPVPIGTVGEIHVGGVVLARGYINKPDLTSECFIPNLFATKTDIKEGNSRLYKTGDLGRFLPDGNIEFLGRRDDQVKLRGFRIECREIEAAILTYENVHSSLVQLQKDKKGNNQLIAYIVPKNLESFTEEREFYSSHGEVFKQLIGTGTNSSFVEGILSHLGTSLPDYMIPAFFILLDRFPLTPNGKLDRTSFPEPDLSLREEPFVEPQTTIERDLANVWSEVLGVSPISIHDNFFRIGGHSLLAVQVISKINRVLGTKLSLIDLFNYPTIYLLSSHVKQNAKWEGAKPIITIHHEESSIPPLFMIHPGGGFSYCYVGLSQYIKDLSIYAINNPNLYNSPIQLNSINDMAQYYIKLIKEIQNKGPYFLGGWSLGGVIAYEIAQQLYSEGNEVKNLILIDSIFPFETKEDIKFLEKIRGEEIKGEYFHCLDEKLQKLIENNFIASSKLIKKYKPIEYLQQGSVILLKAEDGISEYMHHRYNDQKALIPQMTIETIPGSHATLFDMNHIQTTALKLYENIQKESEILRNKDYGLKRATR